MYLIKITTITPNPVLAVHSTGKVRHIGQAELAWLEQQPDVPTLAERDRDAAARLIAEARVSQGYLQG
ncbi:hypothetical protein ACIBF5_09460 [Micromonospora sp. NPDC050417]|uniref:hypothetical protein n=1 Tax=Micromonospora sp. NPDC050417 TaxID=3364280 RepID=UPI003787DBD8